MSEDTDDNGVIFSFTESGQSTSNTVFVSMNESQEQHKQVGRIGWRRIEHTRRDSQVSCLDHDFGKTSLQY